MQIEHRTFSGRRESFRAITERMSPLEKFRNTYVQVDNRPDHLFVNYYLPTGSDSEPVVKDLKAVIRDHDRLRVQFTYAPKDYFR